jgi:acyl-CoA thioester hydrolase
MIKALTYKGAVMTWECDSNGHMNVMYYINKFENAGRNFSLDIGLVSIMEQDPNMGIVVLEQTINYIKEVFEDDLLYVESELVDVGNKVYKIQHNMYNGATKELVSTMKIAVVLFDKMLRKSMIFPAELRDQLLLKIKKD